MDMFSTVVVLKLKYIVMLTFAMHMAAKILHGDHPTICVKGFGGFTSHHSCRVTNLQQVCEGQFKKTSVGNFGFQWVFGANQNE